jgi:S1-C subfamily serine protease
MKKLLLILLCLPMIGMGQDDCGKKPRKPPNFNNSNINSFKKSKKYKAYEEKLKIWKECMSKIGYDYDCKFAKSGKDDFDETISYITKYQRINSLYKKVGTKKYNYFRTSIAYIYKNEKLGVVISHESPEPHKIEEYDVSLYFLLDSNKIKLNTYKTDYSSKTYSGVGQPISKYDYYTGETTYLPGAPYSYDVFSSTSSFILTREQLLILSQQDIRKIRLSFESKNLDVELKESKSNDLLFDANCMYQAITKLNVNNPNDKIKKVNKNTDWAGNGSGFFLSSDGYIATNYHVIDNANKIEVEFKYKDEIKGFNAKVVQIDKTNDLAIIKIDDEEFSNINSIPYNFKTRSADVATEVFALGYPMALTIMGKEIKFTDGKISSKTGLDGDITTYQIQVPIQPGNSGGPLFDYNGNLIGITSSGVNRRLDITENVNYAIKSSYLLNLIDVLPETINLPSSTQLASKPLTEQIKVLSDYVVLIKVK